MRFLHIPFPHSLFFFLFISFLYFLFDRLSPLFFSYLSILLLFSSFPLLSLLFFSLLKFLFDLQLFFSFPFCYLLPDGFYLDFACDKGAAINIIKAEQAIAKVCSRTTYFSHLPPPLALSPALPPLSLQNWGKHWLLFLIL